MTARADLPRALNVIRFFYQPLEQRKHDMSARKARRALKLHHRFLAWAERRGLIAQDPAPAYSTLDRMAGLGRPLSADE